MLLSYICGKISERNFMIHKKSPAKLSIKAKTEHLLDELRIVIPGTEVLLGFQLSVFFTEGFGKLNQNLKNLHLVSLGFILFCVMLLMAPVAYHQIIEKGEDTLRFYKFASKILIFTLIFLGLGLTTEIYVVAKIATNSSQLSLIISGIILGLFYLFWFGFTLFQRNSKQ